MGNKRMGNRRAGICSDGMPRLAVSGRFSADARRVALFSMVLFLAGPLPAVAQSDAPAVLAVPLPEDISDLVAQSLKTPEKPLQATPEPEARLSDARIPDEATLEAAASPLFQVPLPDDITQLVEETLRAAVPAETDSTQVGSITVPEVRIDPPALPEVVVSLDIPRAASGESKPAILDLDETRLRALIEPARQRFRLRASEVEALVAAYVAREFRAFWLDEQDGAVKVSPRAQAVVAALGLADQDGLDVQRLNAALPVIRSGEISREKRAESDLDFSVAAFLYAHDARGGRIEPAKLSPMLTPQLTIPSPGDVLDRLSLVPPKDIASTLETYQPPHAGYRTLRKALGKLREELAAPVLTGAIAGADGAPLPTGELPPNWLEGAPLAFDKADPRVAHLRTRLGLTTHGSNLYDEPLREAVKAFQRANELTPNARITPKTRAALEDPRTPLTLADRRPDKHAQLAAVLANMERWRWLPADLGKTHVFVNIADYKLNLVSSNQVIHETRVIVGKPTTQTPIFSDEMEHLIVNPSWHVPPSILKKEFLPAMAKDPEYAARRGYEVVRRGKSISIRQPPGEKNALGHVKFIFPNAHSVYLHDTPTRHLFQAEARTFSHGCVRVDKPFAFAEKLLAADIGYSEPQLRAMVGRGERMLKLNQKIPVHLAYFTISANEAGEIEQRRDFYGHDARLKTALRF